LRAIDQIVDVADGEAAGQVHVRGVGDQPIALAAGEAPGAPRHGHRCAAGVLAHQHARGGIVELRRGVGDVIPIGHRQHVGGRVGPELAAHEAAGARDARDVQGHHAVAPRHVVPPADPGDRPAVPHQKAVAEVLRHRRIGHAHRAVEHAERDLAAPVGCVEQQAAVAAAGIHGPQQIEIALELDPTIAPARRQPDP
jgi:hypothetical protein